MNKDVFKQIRVSAGLSQREMGELLGLSQTFVSLMEGGQYPISDKTARKVASQFEITPELLESIDRLRKLN